MKESEINTAFLISGEGTTAEAVIRACQHGEISHIRPVVVIASRHDARGLDRARAMDIPTETVARRNFTSLDAFGEALLGMFQKYNVLLVSQNGWLPLTPESVVQAYRGRIINQHPGPLDPGRVDFGGKGMYGARVVCARLAYCWVTDGDAWTESTVHHVTEAYDQGELIRVERLELPRASRALTIAQLRQSPDELKRRTASLQKLLLPLEHQNVIAALAAYGTMGKFPSFQRPNPLIPDEYQGSAMQAKELAVQLYP